jgi:penicillin-insensitive murein endopeptidase
VRSFCLVVVLAAPSPVLARHDVTHPHARRSHMAHRARATHEPSRQAQPVQTPWSQFRSPTAAFPQVIGGYSGGCIDGAVPLPLSGEGWREVRPDRNRIYGHPDLIEYIRDLGWRLWDNNLPALSVSDLGQPRGGPTPTGHASHQTGLDADIWFVPPWAGKALSMIDARHKRPSPLFDEDVVKVLELAASDPRVERIFVNPILKRAVCERTVDEFDRTWLQKLRPWQGHDDHFHVRLACPADSPVCVPQPPLPPGDGCDQLGRWLRAKTLANKYKDPTPYVAKALATPPPPPPPPLIEVTTQMPDTCRALLDPLPQTGLPVQAQADAETGPARRSAEWR